ncbi:MAG: DUF1801 domain-containing protein [Desulfobulbaceae bacterium]|nr:MAG: DUF1801 domain-containing protein [Desulfobulbaceae bacterium]
MDKSVLEVFDSYPDSIRIKMIELRAIILEAAAALESYSSFEETLKWGEPSYLMKGGSTIRIDWKESNPDYLGVYFSCQSKLIDSFRATIGKDFRYEGNRAILLGVDSPLPKETLLQCFSVAFTYHKRKKQPLLGI